MSNKRKINYDMKKIVTFFIAIILSTQLFARISIICDVIHEKSFAEWTDYYRTKVEFISGHEMQYSLEQNKLYAIIWYSQTQCSVIEMEYEGLLLQKKIDKNFMFIYLGFDILNEGKNGVEINGDDKTKWKIYGKDENSFIIDPIFNEYPYNYNDAIYENMRQGIKIQKRKRPQDEIKYASMDKGIVVWNNDPYYIIQSNKNFIVLVRNTFGYWSGTVEEFDMLVGDFKLNSETPVDNITQNQSGMKVQVSFMGNDYQSCVDWINTNIKNI